jgi:hypothetical protein
MSKLTETQFSFSRDVAKLIDYIFAKNYYCSIGEVYRPPETAQLYAKQKRGIANSQHCSRLAIDINLFSPEKVYLAQSMQYKFVGDYWESLNPKNRWGGRFNDGNHFERLN